MSEDRPPPRPDRPLVLIGLRGAGKSTVARILSEKLKVERIDTDDRITAEAGMTIAEIFAREGESGFRRRERVEVRKALKPPPRVVSLGGGAILDPDTRHDLARGAFVVWLHAPSEVLWQRIAADPASKSDRPALTGYRGEAELAALLAQRRPLYEQVADMMLDTGDLTPHEAADRILKHLAATLSDPRRGNPPG